MTDNLVLDTKTGIYNYDPKVIYIFCAYEIKNLDLNFIYYINDYHIMKCMDTLVHVHLKDIKT